MLDLVMRAQKKQKDRMSESKEGLLGPIVPRIQVNDLSGRDTDRNQISSRSVSVASNKFKLAAHSIQKEKGNDLDDVIGIDPLNYDDAQNIIHPKPKKLNSNMKLLEMMNFAQQSDR